jgi:hypothetical protein
MYHHLVLVLALGDADVDVSHIICVSYLCTVGKSQEMMQQLSFTKLHVSLFVCVGVTVGP